VQSNLHWSAIKRAAEIAGSVERLAVYLDMDAGLLAACMIGTEEVPPDVYVKVVDLILEHQLNQLGSPGNNS
jgi:hypothetical protein